MNDVILPFVAFALTAALHGALLLGLVWLLERIGLLDAAALREWSWRAALFGGVLSAGLQLTTATHPLAGEWPVGHGDAQIVVWPEKSASTTTATPTAAAKRDSSDRTQPAAARPAPVVARGTGASKEADVAVATPPSFFGRARSFFTEHWGALAAAAWLAASMLMILRLLQSLVSLRRLAAESEPVVRGDLAFDLADLCARMEIATPKLAVSTAVDSPLATPGGGIVVPEWALSLPRDERRAMLAHELAHVQRHDPLWRTVLAFWHALFCAVPLAGVALRRLDAIAELECDAAAARVLGDGRPLASCLVRCLEQRKQPLSNAFAVAMAAPRSPLMQRAERLLEGVPVISSRLSLSARAVGSAIVLAAAAALPAFSPAVSYAGERIRVSNAEVSSSTSGTHSSLHITNDDGSTRLRLSSPERDIEYTASGKVTFSADETDIASIENGGKASVQEKVGGVKRRVEYTGSDNGVAKRYWRDGVEQPIDADARAWLSTIIPRMMREAGIDAVARVDRFYKAGGARAVLAEISQITSDYARGLYLRTLLGNYALSGDEVDDTLKLTAAIDSDYERRNVLSAALRRQKFDDAGLAALLKIAGSINSDYERTQILMEAAEHVAPKAELRRAWLKAALAMDSDYERRRALTALLDERSTDDVLPEIVNAAAALESDYEKREILRSVASKTHDPESLAVAYTQVSKGLGSDYEQREALMALLHAGRLQKPGVLAVLDAVDEIDSDFERRNVMVALAKTMPLDSEVQARYMAIAQKMSDYEREQVEQAAGFTRG